MTNQQCSERLHTVAFTAGMNLRYHQALETRWSLLDMWMKIVVALLAVIGVILSLVPVPSWMALVAASLSAALAVALNVVPTGERAKFYGEMFRSWNQLESDADFLRRRFESRSKDTPVTGDSLDWFDHLLARENELHGKEPAPDARLINRCEREELNLRYGFETREAIERERHRRLTAPSVESEAVSVGAEKEPVA